jgi:hypothetical protein
MYTCETRWVTGKDKVMLNTQDRQILGTVWAVTEQEVLKIRTDQEPRELYIQPLI